MLTTCTLDCIKRSYYPKNPSNWWLPLIYPETLLSLSILNSYYENVTLPSNIEISLLLRAASIHKKKGLLIIFHWNKLNKQYRKDLKCNRENLWNLKLFFKVKRIKYIFFFFTVDRSQTLLLIFFISSLHCCHFLSHYGERINAVIWKAWHYQPAIGKGKTKPLSSARQETKQSKLLVQKSNFQPNTCKTCLLTGLHPQLSSKARSPAGHLAGSQSQQSTTLTSKCVLLHTLPYRHLLADSSFF